jgi:hypothetical protein
MRRSIPPVAALFVACLAACSGGGTEIVSSTSDAGDSGGSGVDASTSTSDAGSTDATVALSDAGDAAPQVGDASDAADGNGCEWGGAPGECITTSACVALGDHTSYPNECPGPADIECCIVTPSTTLNPPTPAGYVLMQQAQVTAAMTTWAVAILNDPTTYPMFSTTTMVFGTQTVLARVEWHPPDFQNSVVHRGVTLYEPAD